MPEAASLTEYHDGFSLTENLRTLLLAPVFAGDYDLPGYFTCNQNGHTRVNSVLADNSIFQKHSGDEELVVSTGLHHQTTGADKCQKYWPF